MLFHSVCASCINNSDVRVYIQTMQNVMMSLCFFKSWMVEKEPTKTSKQIQAPIQDLQAQDATVHLVWTTKQQSLWEKANEKITGGGSLIFGGFAALGNFNLCRKRNQKSVTVSWIETCSPASENCFSHKSRVRLANGTRHPSNLRNWSSHWRQ